MMHENGFAHRDVKPHNILIKSHRPSGWWIKITDFGILRRIEKGSRSSMTTCGTQGYMAPEIYGLIKRESVYTTDILALGEIIFELLTRKPTFKHIGSLANYVAHPDTFPSNGLANFKVSSPAGY